MTDSIQITVQDKLDITELLARAAYGYDHPDINMLEECFNENAVFSLRIAAEGLIGPFQPRYAIMQWSLCEARGGGPHRETTHEESMPKELGRETDEKRSWASK